MHMFTRLSRRQPQGLPNASPSNTNISPTPTSSPNLLEYPTVTPTAAPSSTPNPGAELTAALTVASSHGSKTSAIIAIVAVLVVLTALISMFFVLRTLRRKHKSPKYIPTSFLKQRWERWEPTKHHRVPDSNDDLEPTSNPQAAGLRPAGRSNVPPAAFGAAARSAVETASNTAASGAAGVDRNTSVRSVMTLPAYNPLAMQNEQVLAREGERGGIDVVIEFPEGANQEEARREEEMEALYQIRLARRRENEEREERRRLRREARERGDYVALREIQERARASSSTSAGQTVEELRAEHDRLKKERQRAVSSVSYADLGIARHDGTRIRQGSMESEREGLLGDAAGMAVSSHYHRRDRSASSVISIDTMNSDQASLGLIRSRPSSGENNFARRTSTSQAQNEDTSGSNEGRAGSSPEIISHEDVPAHDPPGYENISLDTPRAEHGGLEPPPGYFSPTQGPGEVQAASDSLPTLPPQDTTSPIESTGRRFSASRISHLVSNRRRSSSSSISSRVATTLDSRRSSRGVGGVPQLPSLRLAQLPSIHVNSPSPTTQTIDEDSEDGLDHHPEE